MTILLAKKILDKLERFVNLVNTTIGILNAQVEILKDNGISIKIFQKTNGDVSDYLIREMVSNLIQDITPLEDCLEDAYFDETNKTIIISVLLKDNGFAYINNLFKALIKSLYFAVDSAKVEYSLILERDDFHDIPNEVFWQLDEWNEGWLQDGEEEKCISDEQILVYKLEKNALYGMTLGYYDINLDLLETDIIPELIGILFESIEDFCYATSYEDEKYVYIYSCKELSEDNIFDIEEGLFNILHLISETEQTETLEDIILDCK